MTIALFVIAILLFVSVLSLRKFMRDMAVVESDLLKELREMKAYLRKISENRL